MFYSWGDGREDMSEVDTVEVDGLECRLIKFYGKERVFYKVLGEWHRSTKSVRVIEAAFKARENGRLKAAANKTLSRKKYESRKLKACRRTGQKILDALAKAGKPLTITEIMFKTRRNRKAIDNAKARLGPGLVRRAKSRICEISERRCMTWELVA